MRTKSFHSALSAGIKFIDNGILEAQSLTEIATFHREVYANITTRQTLCAGVDIPVAESDEYHFTEFAHRHADKALIMPSFETCAALWGFHHLPHGITMELHRLFHYEHAVNVSGLKPRSAVQHAAGKLVEKRQHLGRIMTEEFDLSAIANEDRSAGDLFSTVKMEGLSYAADLLRIPYFRATIQMNLKPVQGNPTVSHLLGDSTEISKPFNIQVRARSPCYHSVDTKERIENEIREVIRGQTKIWATRPNSIHTVFPLSDAWQCALVSSRDRQDNMLLFEALIVRI